jgi:hypothetical protein
MSIDNCLLHRNQLSIRSSGCITAYDLFDMRFLANVTIQAFRPVSDPTHDRDVTIDSVSRQQSVGNRMEKKDKSAIVLPHSE